MVVQTPRTETGDHAPALLAAVHHVGRADRGKPQPGVIHLADDAEPPVVSGGQPAVAEAFQETPASMQNITGIGRAVGGLQHPGHVVEPPVRTPRRQPAEDLALRLGRLGAYVDGTAPRIEMLVAGIHSLGHGDRALLSQAAREFAEQVPRFLIAQAERGKAAGSRQPGSRPRSTRSRPRPSSDWRSSVVTISVISHSAVCR